jgi:HEAT repeat protein
MLTLLAGSMLYGCGGDGGTSPEDPANASQWPELDSEGVYAEWNEIIANPEKNTNTNRHQMLALTLAAQAPEKLHRMVDLLTDPGTAPESKLLIFSSLEAVLNPELVAQLLELTKPEVDPSVRAGVTMVLAQSGDPAVEERFRELMADDDRRVRFAALNALVMHGDEDARTKLRDMYFEEDTPAPFRERIALTFGMGPQSGDTEVLADAALDERVPEDVRAVVVTGLAMLADPASLPVLQQIAEGGYSDNLKAVARDAMDAIEAKGETSPEAEGGETPAEEPVAGLATP